MPATNTKILRYQELAERIAELIRQGTYPSGERIPSVRQMSQQQNLSISTVLQAYSLLERQGFIEARPQSGYYVQTHIEQRLPEPETSSPQRDPSNVSLHELVMMLMRDSANPNLIQLGAALPHLDNRLIQKINQIISKIVRQQGVNAHQYQFPPGWDALRIQIAQRMVNAGCNLAPGDILITSGGTEAIDFSLHAICRPGDIVAIESPSYFGTLQMLEVHGLRALEIPTHPRDGISLGALEFAIEHNTIRAVMVISNFNNPLGCQIPDERKKALVDLLAKHEIPLIENDVCGELYFGEKRPLVCKAFDTKELVILLSSFSKDISPGLRLGWVAPGRYSAEVEWLKFTLSASSPTLPQMAVAEFFEGGGYDQHLRRIRREYARNVELMSDAVMRYFPEGTRLTRPSGGFVLWVQLPENVDSLELYKMALQGGITLAPGHVFSATYQFSNFIRLNAATFNYSTERALERLGEMIFKLAKQ
ncbi:MAG TPA: PLP-dependent aminotransferase family protein [Anaerolineales bacterium]|nr:PLP-dependent aminotransferase family protein [Anaerolineales bacterium]